MEASKAEQRLCTRLGLEPAAAERLVAAMRAGNSSRTAVVLSPKAPADYEPPFECADMSAAPWLPPRVYVPEAGERPAQYADYEAGLYYVLDVSSCWESAALAHVPPPASSLDLCAAPGGKTMLMAARYVPRAHTANEVNAARRGILRQNIEKCGLPNTEVSGLRPDQWAAWIGSGYTFDDGLVLVVSGGQVVHSEGTYQLQYNGAAVSSSDAIISGATYTLYNLYA